MKKRILDTWRMLHTTIYVGDRLVSNLRALTFVSIATTILGIILTVINITKGQFIPLIASIVTLVAGAACGVFAGVLKDREKAAIIPTVFCWVAFTLYAVTGAGQGYMILWSLLMPIGISYFVSVRHGIILSVYYTLLYSVLFYSPLRVFISQYYQGLFMQRFPLVFAFIAIFTGIAMIQYHKTTLFEIEHTNRLNEEVERQTRKARERAELLAIINDETVRTLARVIDAKDRYTNGHSIRVAQYSVALAHSLGWTDKEVEELEREALLHDIGKIGIPDAVLNKPGKLTDEEFAIIKSHTTVGGDILAEAGHLMGASETARFHHERYDGRGYPEGRSGGEIPVRARLVAIADSYDAMHSDRIYRKGLPNDVIRRELVHGRGTQFDPEFLDAFLVLFDGGVLNELDEQSRY